MDERLQLLSYSALLKLHTCPRKFQLYRLNVQEDEHDAVAGCNQNITFAFGHVVGEGIQNVMAGMSEHEVIWKAFLGWHADLEDRNEKQKKSFYSAVSAIQRFIWLREHGFLEDYELVEYNGRPAIELSFRITLPDGFTMRGSVDAVLSHKETGEILVLECKTSSSSAINQAEFKNSAQGVGYSVVLDVLFKGLSSYKVLYLVYLTRDMSYEQMPFLKSYLQRATWIQELLLDIETIKLYEGVGVYPMRGENCYDFFRPCEYFGTCTLATKHLVKPAPADKPLDAKVYDIELTLDELIAGQLERNTTDAEVEVINNVALLPGDELL